MVSLRAVVETCDFGKEEAIKTKKNKNRDAFWQTPSFRRTCPARPHCSRRLISSRHTAGEREEGGTWSSRSSAPTSAYAAESGQSGGNTGGSARADDVRMPWIRPCGKERKGKERKGKERNRGNPRPKLRSTPGPKSCVPPRYHTGDVPTRIYSGTDQSTAALRVCRGWGQAGTHKPHTPHKPCAKGLPGLGAG